QQIGDRRYLVWPPSIYSRHGAEGCSMLGDDPRSEKVFCLGPGKELRKLSDDFPLHFIVSKLAQLTRSADYNLNVMFTGSDFATIESPLANAVHQNDMRQIHHRPVIPNVDAGYGRSLKPRELREIWIVVNQLGRQ